jgi:hypothetical protein
MACMNGIPAVVSYTGRIMIPLVIMSQGGSGMPGKPTSEFTVGDRMGEKG